MAPLSASARFSHPSKRAKESHAIPSQSQGRISWSQSQTPDNRAASQAPTLSERGAASQQLSSQRTSSVDELQPQPQDEVFGDDTLHEVVMAINVKERGTVGCAYYVAREEKLYCMQDVKLGGEEVVETLKTFISPTVLLLPYSLNEKLIDLLEGKRPQQADDDVNSDAPTIPYQLDFRVSGEWKYESGRSKLMSLSISQQTRPTFDFRVPGDTGDVGDEGVFEDSPTGRLSQLLTLGTSIDIDSRISIGCVGVALGYLNRRRNAAYLPGDEAARSMFRVSHVEPFSLEGHMFINLDTLLSLQIMQAESHPNSQNQGPKNSGAKEGLSVYGLFHHFAKTPQGKALLRQYFLRPSLDIGVINQRLNTVSVLVHPENLHLTEKLVMLLKTIKNMHGVVINLRKGSSGGIMTSSKATGVSRTVWSSIRTFIYACLEIKSAFSEMSGANRTQIFDKMMLNFDGRALATIGTLITDTIDDELSLHQQRTVIKQGVDPVLDDMKQMYQGLESLLSHAANRITPDVPLLLDAQLSVVFFPQIGFLIAVRGVPETTRGVYEGGEDDGWEKMFHTEEFVYYKNSQVREMDDHFGDVYGQICDREIEIIQELTEGVLKHDKLLTLTSDICGELDCLCALAQGAREYDLTRPRMTTENVLEITGGRHILQERTVPTFIANDTSLVGGAGDELVATAEQRATSSPYRTTGTSMLMVTGPNYSGKSVYLKQVALITFMAHVGSFVPASSAIIGLTDKILTRIWTRESVSRMQSAFMIDLQQMSSALSQATRQSLLVIDEFGKGTESYDGAGLAAGVFEHLLSLGDERPKVVAATHFHEIFENDHLPPHPHLAIANMEIYIPPPSPSSSPARRHHHHRPNSAEPITYLYRLTPGRTSSSYGTVCAAMNGVPFAVVARAEALIALAAKGEDLVAACAELSVEEVEDAREAEAVARRFLMWDVGEEEEEGQGEEVGVRGRLEEVFTGRELVGA